MVGEEIDEGGEEEGYDVEEDSEEEQSSEAFLNGVERGPGSGL